MFNMLIGEITFYDPCLEVFEHHGLKESLVLGITLQHQISINFGKVWDYTCLNYALKN